MKYRYKRIELSNIKTRSIALNAIKKSELHFALQRPNKFVSHLHKQSYITSSVHSPGFEKHSPRVEEA